MNASFTTPLSWAAAGLLSVFALHSEPSSRKWFLSAILPLFAISFSHVHHLPTYPVDPSLVALFIIIWCAHVVNVLAIVQVRLKEDLTSLKSTWNTFDRACKVLQNPRWQKTDGTAGKATLAQRLGFLLHRVALIVLFAALRRGLENVSPWRTLHWEDISPVKEQLFRRLHKVSGRELWVRFRLTIAGVPVDQLELAMWHNVLALVFVGTALHQPHEWQKPLYGNPLDAFSMRRFWSVFEHRLAYYSYNALVRTMLSGIGLEDRTFTRRLLQNALVFLISGLLHALAAWESGSCVPWVDAQYYWMNFMALVVEELFFWAAGPILLERIDRSMRIVLGYIWVLAFHFWVSAKWTFPLFRCIRSERLA